MHVVPLGLTAKEMSEEAKRLNRGEFLFRQSGDIVAVAWKDNKVVNVVYPFFQQRGCKFDISRHAPPVDILLGG